MATTHPSPLRNSSTIHSPPSSPTLLRGPTRSRSNSPELVRRTGGVEIISSAVGAEGGVGAIGARRRGSNSFKTMSTGGLVSNSPFTKRLNSNNNTTLGPPSPTTSLYSSSRIPTAMGHTRSASTTSALGNVERKTSGGTRKTSGGRKVSGEEEGGPKENRRTSIDANAPSPTLNDPKPVSPTVPFRPTRNGHGHSQSVSYAASSSTSTTSPFKPSRPSPPSQDNEGPRRTSSSFSAVRKNGLVSSSPFVSNTGGGRPLPTPTSPRKLQQSSLDQSPPLAQALYEIPALQKESAPFNVYPTYSDDIDDQVHATPTPTPSSTAGSSKPTSIASMGMGSRPAGFPVTPRGRNIAGSSAPPPLTPPSGTNSPTSVLSASKRTRGPRAITSASDNEGDETETEDSARRVLKRQPSTKTVTWATEEEVLEFEVEEEERRRSMASTISYASSTSEDTPEGYYEHDDDSLGFEEGGSVEVHDVDTSDEDDIPDDDDESSVVEDMIGELENMVGFTSPNSRFTVDEDDEELTAGARNMFISGELNAAREDVGSKGPSSTFSNTTDEATSESSYDDEEEEKPRVDIFQARVETKVAATVTTLSATTNTGSSYSLPDLPENSPLLPFDDDGVASSVVTMDLAPSSVIRSSLPSPNSSTGAYVPSDIIPPLQSTPIPAHSRANSNPMPIESPIAHIHHQPDIPLSRHASIVDSESSVSTSTASTGSQRGRFKLGREQFEERIRLQEALLEAEGTPPSTSSATAPTATAAEMSKARSLPSAIPARPAPKARSATLSSGMLTTVRGADLVVGSEITAKVADEMQSPLERLGGELEQRHEEEVGELVSKKEGGELSESRSGRRRRSLSTGDVEIEATGTSTSMERFSSMPEYSYTLPNQGSRAADDQDFADGLEDSLSHILQRDRKYHVRESKLIVYANDGLIETNGKAGDVDPGRAWRKKRPSDVHLARSGSTREVGSKKENLSGEIFLKVVCADFLDLPIPSHPTKVHVALDNGKQRAEAGAFTLAPTTQIAKEFALSSVTKFKILLQVPTDDTHNQHLLTMQAPLQVPDTPSKKNRFLNILSSPKKGSIHKRSASNPPIVPDRLLQHVDVDNVLAAVSCDFKDFANACRMKRNAFRIPLVFGSSQTARRVTGTLTVELLWVPSVPGTKRSELPESMAKAEEGLRAAAEQMNALHEGILTQLGGDCKTWRRRHFKLRGSRLVPYSEVTKKALVEVDLTLAEGLVDPDQPLTNSKLKRSPSSEDEDDPWRMANSFKILFRDGTDISFFADTAEEKKRWMECLQKAGAAKNAPLWAERCLKYRKVTP